MGTLCRPPGASWVRPQSPHAWRLPHEPCPPRPGSPTPTTRHTVSTSTENRRIIFVPELPGPEDFRLANHVCSGNRRPRPRCSSLSSGGSCDVESRCREACCSSPRWSGRRSPTCRGRACPSPHRSVACRIPLVDAIHRLGPAIAFRPPCNTVSLNFYASSRWRIPGGEQSQTGPCELNL